MQILSGIRYGTEIAAAARAHGLDPKLLAAVAAQETGGPGESSGNNVVGDGGHGHGLFQIDDRSWAFARTGAAMDPAANAQMAASILSDDLDRYGGDVHKALSAYNSGSPTATGTTTTWADGQTLGYADSVLRHYAELGGNGAASAADGNLALGYSGDPPLSQSGDPSAFDRGVNAPTTAFGGPGTGATIGLGRNGTLADTLGQLNLLSPNAAAALAALPPPAATTPTQTTWRSWASLDAGAADPGAQADQLVANLLDPGADDASDQ